MRVFIKERGFVTAALVAVVYAVSVPSVWNIAGVVALGWFVGGLAFITDRTPSKSALAGKTVVITGSSSGIGECLAYEYSKLGCNLVLAALEGDLLENVKNNCKKHGAAQVEILQTDLTKPDDCKATIDLAIREFGTIDILHLNHARLEDRQFRDYKDLKSLQRFFDVNECNYYSYVRLTHFALPYLLENKNGASVACTCSGGIAGPLPFDGSYVASKSALRSFFHTLRCELKLTCPADQPPISVTIMFPGAIKTNFTLPHKDLAATAFTPAPLAKSFVNAVFNKYDEVFYPKFIALSAWLGFLAPSLMEYTVVNLGYINLRPDYVKRLDEMKAKL